MNVWRTDAATKRRDKLGIISEILEIAKGGTLKTQIMYKANLSFAQLNEYIDYMLKTDLLEKLDVNRKEVYVATDKGIDFVQKHAELAIMLGDDNDNLDKHRNGAKFPPQNLLRKA